MLLEQAELRYEGVSLPMGSGTPFRLTGFQRGVAARRVDDADRPRMDGVGFGRDFKGAAVHELGVAIFDGTDRVVVRGLVEEFESVWDAERVRLSPGRMAELRVGPDRVCFGRPRDLTPNDVGLWDGVGQATVQFVAADDRWYGPEEAVSMRLAPTYTGGLPVPAEVPFVLGGGTGEADSIMQVAGKGRVRPVFELHGPIQDPWVDVPGVGRLRFSVTLAYDQVLTVDTRPWASGVKRDGAPLPGALLAAGARLSDMAVPPGSYQVIFGGYDPSGTSELTVRWRPSYPIF